MTDILRTIDLSKRFRHIVALDHMNMTVPQGSVYGLVGPNGAGKTTTIKILMNILQSSGGTAELFGRDSRKLLPRDFTQIGYVSENQQMPEWMTVEYFMNYLKPFYPNWDTARARELLKQFDLPLDRKLRHLSRGMRMKAALASSLAYRPPLLILDEPFTGLDALVRDEFIAGMLECAEDATILISSHDLAEIETFASHIGYLDKGRLQFSEEMTSLAERFREIEVTLTPPTNLTAQSQASWPAAWLNREQSATQVRFVDSHFDRERTMAEVQGVFGEVRQVSVNPMPLRAIFVTLAKAGRKAA